MMRIPAYLQRHSSGIFYFRIAVPGALKSHLKLREIKCSLRTRFKHEAIFRAQPLSLTMRHVFDQLSGEPMDYKDARVLLDRYLNQKLADFDRHFEKHGPMPFDKRFNLHQGLKAQRNWAALDLPSDAGIKAAERILKAEGIKFDPNSAGFQKFASWATKMVIAQAEGILAKDAALAFVAPEQRREAANEGLPKNGTSGLQGSPEADTRPSQGGREAAPEVEREASATRSPATHQPVAIPTPQPIQPATSAEPTLSTVLKVYTAEKLKEGSWTDKTQETAGSKHNLLVRIIGDVPMRAIGTAQARDYKQVLQQLPRNLNTKPLYRSKTISQILALKPEAGMSVTTINNYLAWASTCQRLHCDAALVVSAEHGSRTSAPSHNEQTPIAQCHSSQGREVRDVRVHQEKVSSQSTVATPRGVPGARESAVDPIDCHADFPTGGYSSNPESLGGNAGRARTLRATSREGRSVGAVGSRRAHEDQNASHSPARHG
jgi:hypothetical protein